MSRKTIISCLQSILPAFNKNIQRHSSEGHRTIFTNKYIETLYKNKNEIDEVNKLRNGLFLPNYCTLVDELKNTKNQGLVLVVGDPHQQLYQSIQSHKLISLEELCALFPEKVPLSYRKKLPKEDREKLQGRIEANLQKEPHIDTIVLTGQTVKMWDEAIQVILDCHPSKIIVEYSQLVPDPSGIYRLDIQDFLSALKECHKIVYTPETLPTLCDLTVENNHIVRLINNLKANSKIQDGDTVVIDEDLVNNKQQLIQMGIEVEKIGKSSQLWG